MKKKIKIFFFILLFGSIILKSYAGVPADRCCNAYPTVDGVYKMSAYKRGKNCGKGYYTEAYPYDETVCRNVGKILDDLKNKNYLNRDCNQTYIFSLDDKEYAYGSFSSWWYRYKQYCEGKQECGTDCNNLKDLKKYKPTKKVYSKVSLNYNFGIYGIKNKVITITPLLDEFKGKLKEKKDYDSITIEGTKDIVDGETVSTPPLNSPFIYFKNAPEGKFSLKLSSRFDNYKAIPKLNKNNSWEGIIKDDKFVIDNKENKNLFYELELTKVYLNRNGKNFSSKEELINYLTKSDFFEKMGFTKEQKENSLNYLLPKIKESPNYYLTILNNNSIENISNLKFSKQPEEFIRKFFAIYPTKTKVKINGGFIFPKKEKNINNFQIIETGEILVNNNMFVFWEK